MRPPDGRLAPLSAGPRSGGRATPSRADARMMLVIAGVVLAVCVPAVLLGLPPWVVVVPTGLGIVTAIVLKAGGLKAIRERQAVHQAVLDDLDGRVITGPSGEVLFTNNAFKVLAGGGSLATAVGGDEESVVRLDRKSTRLNSSH